MTKEERREYYRKWWAQHREEQLAKRKASHHVQRIANERYTVTRQAYSHGYFSKRSITQAYEQRRKQNTTAG